MSRWLKHFLKLRDSAAEISVGRDEVDHDLALDESVDQSLPDTVLETKPSLSLEEALLKGLEVSLADVDLTASGWQYRSQPVMVYGVDVAECEDGELREEFFHRIHLTDCCGALENPEQRVWVASRQSTIELPGRVRVLVPCEYCLARVNYRDFQNRSIIERQMLIREFNFTDYIAHHSNHYFTVETPHYWQPGAPLKPLILSKTAGGACESCQWLEPSGWLLNTSVSLELFNQEHTCLLCAQRQNSAVIMAPEQDVLSACEARYRYWLKEIEASAEIQADSAESDIEQPDTNWAGSFDTHRTQEEPRLAWDQIALHLPVTWQNLLTPLQQLDAPKLFHRFAGYEGVAVLAWPEHRRAIIGADQDLKQLPEGWQFWTPQQVLESL